MQYPGRLRSCIRAARSMALAVPLVALAGCGNGDAPEPDATTGSRGAGEPTAFADLGADRYAFEQATCDLEDAIDDDILARASGTTPDGRRASIEVERLHVGSRAHERVTVHFGRMVEGDQWHATASGEPGGAWFTGDLGGEPRDGPLIVIRGGELTAEGSFRHETRDEVREGSVRIVCAGG